MPNPDDATIIAATTLWLERAVIGLNLCPFAKAVHNKGQIRWLVSRADTEAGLLDTLRQELQVLCAADPLVHDTTLLIVPDLLQEFLLFNDFLGRADRLLQGMDLEGVVQIASFHPDYQFADSGLYDMANFTNRSPFATLHLLREDSVDRAVAAYPNAAQIFGKNIETLENLGPQGWNALGLAVQAREPGAKDHHEKS